MNDLPVYAKWLLGLLLTVLVALVVWRTANVLAALSASFLMAYAAEPAVSWMEARRIPRALGTILLGVVLLLAVAVTFGVAVPRIATQIGGVAERVDVARITDASRWPTPLRDFVESHQAEIAEAQRSAVDWLKENAASLAKSLGRAISKLLSSLVRTVLFVLNLVVVPIFTFYLLVDWHSIRRGAQQVVPPRWRTAVFRVAGEIDLTLRQFLRGQFLVSATMAVLYALGLGVIGTPLGILVGLVAGLMNMVPYLGLAVGLVPALLLDFLQYQSWSRLLAVVLVFVVVQNIEGWLLTPRLVGRAVGLHPLTVLLAVLVGGELLGFAGILLGVPAAAVLSVLLRELAPHWAAPRTDGETA